MNAKRLMVCIATVFVMQAVVAGVLFEAILNPFIGGPTFARPEGQEKLLPYFGSRVLFVTLYCYIYVRWVDWRGWAGGLRYGIVVWLFYSVPMTVGFWSFFEMPGAVAWAWIGIGLVEHVAGGLILALIYGSGAVHLTLPESPASQRASS